METRYYDTISNLHASKNKLHPTWNKVTSTPWTEKARLCGGYGKKLYGTTISDDMPEYFTRTDKFPQHTRNSLSRQQSSVQTKVSRGVVNSESLGVLPGGSHTVIERPVHGRRILKLKCDKQIILEPVITDRSLSQPTSNSYK